LVVSAVRHADASQNQNHLMFLWAATIQQGHTLLYNNNNNNNNNNNIY
jgi:hypothetical protein